MAFTLTPGYVWTDGEVVTATKLNLAATPTATGGQTYAFGSGSAGAPSISFSAESTLGFYRYGAASVGLSGSLYTINAAANTQFQFGQDSTHNLNMLWTYNATAANASAVFGTFNLNNDLTVQAKNLNFDSSSLAFALRIIAAGRVIAGGGSVTDDGASALQTSSFVSYTGPTFGTNAATGYTTGLFNGASGGAVQFQKAGVNYGLVYGDNTNTVVDSGTSPNIVLAIGGTTKIGINSTGAGVIGTLTASSSFGVNGAGAIAKPTVTGSRGGNAALASVLTALATYGLITDSSS